MRRIVIGIWAIAAIVILVALGQEPSSPDIFQAVRNRDRRCLSFTSNSKGIDDACGIDVKAVEALGRPEAKVVSPTLPSPQAALQGRDKDRSSFEVRRLSPRVLLVYGGPGSVSVHSIALASRRGIVVIDTNISPRIASGVKDIIQRAFGRDDFRYVVNTHSDADHCWGNAAFAGTEIIAQERAADVLKGITRSPGEALRTEIEYSQAAVAQWKERLAGRDLSPQEEEALRRKIDEEEALLAEYRGEFVFAAPTIAFQDRLTVDLGDLTLVLRYYGRSHKEGDTIVTVPEEGLVLTGDLRFDFSLGYSSDPAVVPERTFDVPRWLEVLDEVLREPDKLRWVVLSHHLDPWTPADLTTRRDYLQALWAAVGRAQDSGASLEGFLKTWTLEAKFPRALSWNLQWAPDEPLKPAERIRCHENLIKIFWRLKSGRTSSRDR